MPEEAGETREALYIQSGSMCAHLATLKRSPYLDLPSNQVSSAKLGPRAPGGSVSQGDERLWCIMCVVCNNMPPEIPIRVGSAMCLESEIDNPFDSDRDLIHTNLQVLDLKPSSFEILHHQIFNSLKPLPITKGIESQHLIQITSPEIRILALPISQHEGGKRLQRKYIPSHSLQGKTDVLLRSSERWVEVRLSRICGPRLVV